MDELTDQLLIRHFYMTKDGLCNCGENSQVIVLKRELAVTPSLTSTVNTNECIRFGFASLT